VSRFGHQSLEEVSLTKGDVKEAYSLLGYDEALAQSIGVEPEDAPVDFILGLHKKEMAASMSSYQRSLLSKALLVIGKERDDMTMIRLARDNKTFVSVDEAYAAFGAPRECTDEGLIL